MALDPTMLLYTQEQLLKSDRAILTKVSPKKAYIDGKPTDTIIGWRYDILAQDHRYLAFSVTVTSAKPAIQPELLESLGSISCTVKGLEGRFYRTREGGYAFTATATDLEVDKE